VEELKEDAMSMADELPEEQLPQQPKKKRRD